MKNFLFGTGFGMVMVSLLFMVALQLQKQEVKPIAEKIDKEEIIEEAEKLGMIFMKDLPESTEELNSHETFTEMKQINEKDSEELTNHNVILNTKEIPMEIPSSITEEKDEIEKPKDISVVSVHIPLHSNSLQVSDILFQHGIIKDRDGFHDYLEKENVTKKLRSGDYEMSSNMDFEAVVKCLVAGR